MQETIAIVDRGRGPQLSTSRITVQDLVPYFQMKCGYDEIIDIVPVLTVDEIQAVEKYVEEHFEEVMAEDRRIRERAAARRQAPEAEAAERKERLERLERARPMIRERLRERNGDRSSR